MNREFLEAGVPATVAVLLRMFRLGNRFIVRKVLELWLTNCKPLFKCKKRLSIWEFLFLYCNTSDRDRLLIEKLPKASHQLVKESPDTFKLEKDLHMNRAPDKWLQKHFSALINFKKVSFYMMQQASKVCRRRRRKPSQKKLSTAVDRPESALKQILRVPSLYTEIKTNLIEARSRLKSAGHSRSTSAFNAESKAIALTPSLCLPSTQALQISPILVTYSSSPSVATLHSPRGIMIRPSTAFSHKIVRSTCVSTSQLDLPSKQVYRAELARFCKKV